MAVIDDLTHLKAGDLFACDDGTFENLCVVDRVTDDMVAGIVVNGLYDVFFDRRDGTVIHNGFSRAALRVTYAGDTPTGMAAAARDVLARNPRLPSAGLSEADARFVDGALAAMRELAAGVEAEADGPRM